MKSTVSWSLIMAFVALLLWEKGGTNPDSRFATLRAICRDFPKSQTFRINEYRELTVDWSRTPDGSYYSNKAPGPMLVAAPLYCLYAGPLIGPLKGLSENGAWSRRSVLLEIITSILFQIIPWALALSLLIPIHSRIFSFNACDTLRFCALATLGSTVTLFFNTFFGHAFSAWLWLLVWAAFLTRSNYLLGLSLGFSLLSDYAAAFAFPAVFIALILRDQSWRSVVRASFKLAAGAAFPAALWCWYHITAFGSPFALPQKYQNPEFVDLAHQAGALWGVISFYPKLSTVFELLVGPSRGLLVTQPWVLLILGCEFWRRVYKKESSFWESAWILSLGAFAGHFFMNASFGSWHGGYSSGPRYLSPVIPLLAPWVILELKRQRSKVWTFVLSASLVYSILFQLLAMSSAPQAKNLPILAFMYDAAAANWPKFWLRFLGLVVVWGGFLLWYKRKVLRPAFTACQPGQSE